jgi:LysR family transcriptional regulator, regulatory protein for tcuABC
MELRQLRYYVRVVELGSMGRAAADLGVVTSALSQQISRLEGELATRLLVRQASGVTPTDAGLAFLGQAQLALRHADDAVRAAQQQRLSGHVSVGLAPTTGAVLGLPLMQAMRSRYPEVRLHLVESLSGHLSDMLNARRLDLAVLFRTEDARRWSVLPLLSERLFLIAAPTLPGLAALKGSRSAGARPAEHHRARVRLAALAGLPLILPTGTHGLRATLDAAFAAVRATPVLAAEIDSLALLMDAVRAGLGATVQPGAAIARVDAGSLLVREVADAAASRPNLLVSVSDGELSPASLATRVVLADVARELVRQGRWPGATLHEP